jgi:arylsulfatase A-like enzyme
MTTRPPNVLLILSDQHRADALGCYGNPIVATPHLDRLAARSVRFDAAHTHSPVCVPGRYALYTGRYAHSLARVRYPAPDPAGTGWLESEPGGLGAPSLREPTLGHRFRAAGSVAGFIGKLHPVAPHTYGFD